MNLAEITQGVEAPVSDEPIHKLERPSYNRSGLYGRTPFRVTAAPKIIALHVRQTCKSCETQTTYFGGLFCDQQIQGLQTQLTVKNRIGFVERERIQEVVIQEEQTDYCSSCLSSDTLPIGDKRDVNDKPLVPETGGE